MRRLRLGVAVLGLLVLASGGPGQDRSEDKTTENAPPGKLKGYLPKNFKRLGLSDEQKQQIYRLRATYKNKLDQLKKQMDEMRHEEKVEVEKLLTPAQRARLKEIRDAENP
jgi:hypothetical protein